MTVALSIVVPVLNESQLIVPFLHHLRGEAPTAEIIVVDGGSNDGTPELGQTLADQVIRQTDGRAAQMNAGAAIARGEIIWFLHVDSQLPSNAVGLITCLLTDLQFVGGCFRLRFPRKQWIYRVSDSLGNVGVDIFGFALGDHGIFCRRVSFEKAGGFPLLPILEDAELYRGLRRVGRMRQLSDSIVSSPRRYEMLGPYRTTIYYAMILVLYVSGVSVERLNKIYKRLHRKKTGHAEQRNQSTVSTPTRP